MSKRIVPVALLSSLTLIAGVVFAAEPVYPTNPVQSFTTLGVAVAKARADVQKELADFRSNPVLADAWQDVGGERGWALIPHRFDFVGGKLAHTNGFLHRTPKPSLSMSSEGKGPFRDLYKNAF